MDAELPKHLTYHQIRAYVVAQHCKVGEQESGVNGGEVVSSGARVIGIEVLYTHRSVFDSEEGTKVLNSESELDVILNVKVAEQHCAAVGGHDAKGLGRVVIEGITHSGVLEEDCTGREVARVRHVDQA
jgi:hypothetical protein